MARDIKPAINSNGQKLTTVFNTDSWGGIMPFDEYNSIRKQLSALKSTDSAAFNTLKDIAMNPDFSKDGIQPERIERLDTTLKEIGGNRLSGTLEVLKEWNTKGALQDNHQPEFMVRVETGIGPRGVHPNFWAKYVNAIDRLIEKSPDWADKLLKITSEGNHVNVNEHVTYIDAQELEGAGLTNSRGWMNWATAAVIKTKLAP